MSGSAASSNRSSSSRSPIPIVRLSRNTSSETSSPVMSNRSRSEATDEDGLSSSSAESSSDSSNSLSTSFDERVNREEEQEENDESTDTTEPIDAISEQPITQGSTEDISKDTQALQAAHLKHEQTNLKSELNRIRLEQVNRELMQLELDPASPLLAQLRLIEDRYTHTMAILRERLRLELESIARKHKATLKQIEQEHRDARLELQAEAERRWFKAQRSRRFFDLQTGIVNNAYPYSNRNLRTAKRTGLFYPSCRWLRLEAPYIISQLSKEQIDQDMGTIAAAPVEYKIKDGVVFVVPEDGLKQRRASLQ